MIMTTTVNQSPTKPIYQTSVHWIKYIIPIIMLLIGSFSALIVITGVGGTLKFIAFALCYFLFKGLYLLLENISTKVVITQKGQIIFEKGFLNKTNVEVDVLSLNGIIIFQPLLGTILNYGTVILTTAGIKESFNIKNPKKLREQINNLKTY